MIVSADMDDNWRQADGGLVKAVRKRFEQTLPLQELLNEKLSGVRIGGWTGGPPYKIAPRKVEASSTLFAGDRIAYRFAGPGGV